jgi:glutathione S-transferase
MNEVPVALPVLHQFRASHFNEKARWGLAWKGVDHVRRTHLPGPHAFAVGRLSGQTATPVLVIGEEVIAGSARILDALERRYPERPLYPDDPALRRRALALQTRFDEEVGPAVRTAIFSVLIDEPDHLCRIFSEGKPWAVRALYRASFPLARSRIAQANGLTAPGGVSRALEATRVALDFVAKELGPSGQLAGPAFSVADLAAASLLAPLVALEHPDMRMPSPAPPRVAALLARWADHETVAWVREQYRRHRPAPCAAAARP